MKIDTGDVKYGFWVGIGLLMAVLAWGLLNHLAHKAVHKDG